MTITEKKEYNKLRYLKDKDKDIIRRELNKEKKKEYDKLYRKNNKKSILLYRKLNSEKIKEVKKVYSQKNKNKRNEQQTERRKNDVLFKLNHNIGSINT